MDQRLTIFARQLDDLAAIDQKRQLRLAAGHDFASNDYLGLKADPHLADILHAAIDCGIPHGSGGSRLLRGHDETHDALEAFAASHYGSGATLYFSTGFAANSALFATLPQRGDRIFHDALIHASAHDGMRASRADHIGFAHNDMTALEDALRDWRIAGATGTAWIAVESLYSMDGDRAPLDDLAKLASRFEAMLLIDEAHATGVFGDAGRGLVPRDLAGQDHVICLRTCGKALGSEGGLICCAPVIRDFLINRARGFIFSTAPSPLMAHLTHYAIRHIADTPQLQQDLHDLCRYAATRLSPWVVENADLTQILPVILGDNERAVASALALQGAGFDVRAIRPPTVPKGTARLRLCVTRNVSLDIIDALAATLESNVHASGHGRSAA